MRRLLPWLSTALMNSATASAQIARPIDINETGRVLAQLDDVRAIFLVLIVVIILLMGIVLWVVKLLIGNLTKAVEGLARSMDKMSEASAERMTAELVHNARVESVLSRVESSLAGKPVTGNG